MRTFARVPSLDAIKTGAEYRDIHVFPDGSRVVELADKADMLDGVPLDETNDVVKTHLDWWAGELERRA